jgi:hypothetical protein
MVSSLKYITGLPLSTTTAAIALGILGEGNARFVANDFIDGKHHFMNSLFQPAEFLDDRQASNFALQSSQLAFVIYA